MLNLSVVVAGQTVNSTKSKPLPNPLGAEDVASYMSDMSLQMLKLARGHGFTALEQIFEAAYYEAYARAHPVAITPEQLAELESLLAKPATKHR